MRERDAYWESGFEQAISECLKAVDAEEELDGPIPDAVRLVPLEDALRAAVRATKKGIRKRIEKLTTQEW